MGPDASSRDARAPRASSPDARRLFAPLGPDYDRTAALLSFGQDLRWKRFLVSRVAPALGRESEAIDVATGTAAVAIALARQTGCRVVGLDQSPEMLAVGRERVGRAGLAERIRLVEERAQQLPFADGSFDALTVTYLLRYVEDPAAQVRELLRVLRPGGPFATLEFAVPRGLWRPLWELHVGALLPAVGRAISPAWGAVGRFLGGNIRDFYRDHPLEEQLGWWRAAGAADVHVRRLSVGGATVIWGHRE